jgi:hypothetical protein
MMLPFSRMRARPRLSGASPATTQSSLALAQAIENFLAR